NPKRKDEVKMKSSILLGSVAFITAFLFGDYSLGGRLGDATLKLSSQTYANGQTDTITYSREAGLSGLSFGIHFGDSVDFQNIVLRRVVNGQLAPFVTGDSLIATGGDSATAAGARLYTITLAPLAEQYKIF